MCSSFSHQIFITQDVLEAGELAKLAYFNDIVVGAVCCRVDMQGAGRKVGLVDLLSILDPKWLISRLLCPF